MIKLCVECGTQFETKRVNKTCSVRCSRKRNRKKITEWQKVNSLATSISNRKSKLKNKIRVDNYRTTRRNSKSGYIDRFLERAKIECPDTNLTRNYIEHLIQEEKCAITGVKFEYINNYECSQNPLAPSLDRINSLDGYYIGNVQIVLSCINSMKKDMPNEDFIKLWEALKNA